MAAIEDGLRYGPVHIVKCNRPVAVVLTEDECQRLAHGKACTTGCMGAVQWLFSQPSADTKGKAVLDAELRAEREAWGAA